MKVGFAMCGSFCTYSKVFPIMELLSRDYQVVPVFSEAAYTVDSRFGTAKEHIETAQEICGTEPLHTISQVVGGYREKPSAQRPPDSHRGIHQRRAGRGS